MPAHVSAERSGIVTTHITAIERVVRARNAFLFVRPTEYDSTVLIQEGYRTKSVDVHAKSSNWGPMAGFVPCDPAFSKKLKGLPQPDVTRLPGDDHGVAVQVQLYLSDAVLRQHTQRRKVQRIAVDSRYLYFTPGTGRGGTIRSDERPAHLRATAAPSGDPVESRLYSDGMRTESGPRSTDFLLRFVGGQWRVWWIRWTENRDGMWTGTAIPLMVWAYGAVPVTGDYDIWMVAPHITDAVDHMPILRDEDAHGPWAASPYVTALLADLNDECLRRGNPVFNHGAEAQNYGFAQARDIELVMFTPVGESWMVGTLDVPQIMADLTNAGYFVLYNKRWGELDPHLGGKADPRPRMQAVATQAAFLQALDTLRWIVANPRSAAVQAGESQPDTVGRSAAAVRTALDRRRATAARWNVVRTAVHHGLERAQVVEFYDQMRALFEWSSTLGVLREGDFPAGQRMSTERIAVLQRELEVAVSQHSYETGQTHTALVRWATDHAADIRRLQDRMTQQWPIGAPAARHA